MPRPPEAGDYVVLVGWSIVGLHKSPSEAQAQAYDWKRQQQQSRVTIGYITEQLPAQLPEPTSIRKEEV